MTSDAQPGILASVPKTGRYLTFRTRAGASVDAIRNAVQSLAIDESLVVGLGPSLVSLLGGTIDALHGFPARTVSGIEIPATPQALWCWLRADDEGELVHRSLALRAHLQPVFDLAEEIDAFQYGESRDLSGYVDGTENPTGDAAVDAAVVPGQQPGLAGSSFVAVQRWIHDLEYFMKLPEEQRDNIIGRHLADNEEFDAPASAHVKRTAQEDFSPEAFVVRRSMPWSDANQSGLVFVAFGHSLAAFEALLARMLGDDDGIMDALFRFTRPVTGAYFWCPPVVAGSLDLQALKASST